MYSARAHIGRSSGRSSWRRLPAVLFGVAAALLAACGGPAQVGLTELVHDAPRFDGREIVVQGVVRSFGAPDTRVEPHLVIQDANDNRVRLLPDDAAEPHVGSAVEVTGEFRFNDERGRELTIDTIESLHR